MAKEISRTYDTVLCAVIVQIQDCFGNVSPHTIHLMNVTQCPNCGRRVVADDAGNVDINATVAAIITEIDTTTAAMQAKMTAAGWTPPTQW
jgi:hypothetical protein